MSSGNQPPKSQRFTYYMTRSSKAQQKTIAYMVSVLNPMCLYDGIETPYESCYSRMLLLEHLTLRLKEEEEVQIMLLGNPCLHDGVWNSYRYS